MSGKKALLVGVFLMAGLSALAQAPAQAPADANGNTSIHIGHR